MSKMSVSEFLADLVKNEDKYRQRIAELEEREARLDSKLRVVNKLEEAERMAEVVAAKEVDLDKKLKEVETKLREREIKLVEEYNKMKYDLEARALRDREKYLSVRTKEEEVAVKEKQLIAQMEMLEMKEASIAKREQVVREGENKLQTKKARLAAIMEE